MIEPISRFVLELTTSGTSPATRQSYCYDLLRWSRFCSAVQVRWQEARREEVRDFVRWLQAEGNPQCRRSIVARRQHKTVMSGAT